MDIHGPRGSGALEGRTSYFVFPSGAGVGGAHRGSTCCTRNTMSASHSFFCGDVSFCREQHRRLSTDVRAWQDEAAAEVGCVRRAGSCGSLLAPGGRCRRCQRKSVTVILPKWSAF